MTRIAPSRITPWIALAPDISGVCSVEETLEITSMPTKTLSTKIVSQTTASFMRRASFERVAGGLVADRAAWVTQEPATISSSKSGAKRHAVLWWSSASAG